METATIKATAGIEAEKRKRTEGTEIGIGTGIGIGTEIEIGTGERKTEETGIRETGAESGEITNETEKGTEIETGLSVDPMQAKRTK